MKEKNNLLRLMDYAGSFKYFTIGSIVLSAVSACLALMPFVYIWKIIDEVLSVMPDYSKATNIEEYGMTAVKYAINAMCIYFCALGCSHVGGFRTVANIRKSCMSKVMRLPLGYIIWKIIDEVLSVMPDYSKATNIEEYGMTAVKYAINAMCIYFCALGCSHVGGFRTVANIRKSCMSKVMRLPLGYIETEGSGKIRKIIIDSTASMDNFLEHIVPDRTVAISTPIAMIALLMYFDWKIGLLCLSTIIVGFLIMGSFMTGPKLKKDMEAYNLALENMTKEAVEYVRGIPVVKTFGQSVFSFKKLKKAIDDYAKFTISYTQQFRIPMTAFTIVINSSFAILIAIALYHNVTVSDHELLTNLMFYIIFTPIIAVTLNKLMYSSEAGMIVSNAFSRIDSVLNVAELKDSETPQFPKDNSVEFQNVSFRYDGATKNAVDEISIKISAGSQVAFVGPSGGGKTTLASLVSRFWDVTEGKILIGDVDVRDIPQAKLSETVSFVFQDSKLLKTSILDNVRIAKPSATEQEVMDVLERAQCSDIIAKLPDGVNTVIGSKGTYLSGGEQQRIAIARTMLRNAPILVLDEATAFADPENEEKVLKAFNEISKGKTVIKIAHRLSTVVDCDQIFVLKDGKIIESGKHQQLMSQNGTYSKMFGDYQKSVEWKIEN